MAGAADGGVGTYVPRRAERRSADRDSGSRGTENGAGQRESLAAPALQGDRIPVGCQGTEGAKQVAGVPLDERAQLSGAGHPSRGSERLSEFVGGEVTQRPPVNAL